MTKNFNLLSEKIGYKVRQISDTLFLEGIKFNPEKFKAIISKHKAQEWFVYAFRSFKARPQAYLSCKWISKHIGKDQAILETGAGVGINLLWLSEQGFKQLYGFDIDRTAVNAAQEIFENANNEVSFWKDDALQPSNIDQIGKEYAVIIGLNWMYLVSNYNLEDFLAEYRKYLMAGGFIIIDTIDTSYNSVTNNLFCTEDFNKSPEDRRESEYKKRYSIEEVKEIAQSKGFKIDQVFYERHTMVPRNLYILKNERGSGANE
jgi:2-polyprenyl-3-methyl-5-hydroxy-6-metoxy-1,4-benzoquinol methylase